MRRAIIFAATCMLLAGCAQAPSPSAGGGEEVAREITFQARVEANAFPVNMGGASVERLPPGELVSANLTATWSPTSPTATSLRIFFGEVAEGAAPRAVVEAEGASPLMIEVPVEKLRPGASYGAWAERVDETSPIVSQDVTVVLKVVQIAPEEPS